MAEELVSRSIELPSGPLRVLQPDYAAELPDDGPVEWAPVAPYWSVLWRSGVTLARELDGAPLRGVRVVELGCGLALPSIAAARPGATCSPPTRRPRRWRWPRANAEANGVHVDTAARGLVAAG